MAGLIKSLNITDAILSGFTVSVAVQKGNAASVLGSAGNMDSQDFFEPLTLC